MRSRPSQGSDGRPAGRRSDARSACTARDAVVHDPLDLRRIAEPQDQPPQVALERLGRHVPDRGRVGPHRDQVRTRRRVDALVPEPGEVVGHPGELGVLGLLRRKPAVDRRHRGRRIGPMGQERALLQREVEQRREHQRGQFDRHALDPVEGPPRGSSSSTRRVRSRISGSSRDRLASATIAMPPRSHRDEYTLWLVSTAMMSW